MVHEENLSQEVIHFAKTGVLVKIQSWFLQTDMAKLSTYFQIWPLFLWIKISFETAET